MIATISNAHGLTCECEVRPDGVGIHLVGVHDETIKHALLSVVTGIQACGYKIPGKKVIFNVKGWKKQYTHEVWRLHMPMALALLKASGQADFDLNEPAPDFALTLSGTLTAYLPGCIISHAPMNGTCHPALSLRDYVDGMVTFKEHTHSQTLEGVRKAAREFLSLADELNTLVSAYIDGSCDVIAEDAYWKVRAADKKFIDAVNAYEGENGGYEYGLNYELAESYLNDTAL